MEGGSCCAAGDNSIDKADIKKLKESGVFGPLTFWVTEIKNLEELGNPNAGVSLFLRGGGEKPC